jgi:signal transduction histidine kinase
MPKGTLAMNNQRIRSAQFWLQGVAQRVLYFWEKAVQPPPSIEDPEIQRRARTLNRILVVIIPVTLLILIIQLAVSPIEKLPVSTTISSVMMGLASALFIYFVNRVTQNYRLVSYLLVAVGIVAILVNALSSTPPHLEISLLVLLALVGTLLLSLWETILLCIVNTILLLGFGALVPDMPNEIVKDLLVYMSLIQLFIVFVAHHRNLLEADRQQLALASANHKVLTRLITDLSHDFRTPLAIVNNSTYLLARTDDPLAREEKSEQIISQVQRLSKMLDDILMLSRLDTAPDPSLTMVNVNTLVQTLLEEFQFRLKGKTLQLEMVLMASAPPLYANRANLHRALSKIVENAVHYTADGGSITIYTTQRGNTLVIEVVDTGVGIDPADLPHVFDYFFRGDKARSSADGSTGLGLSIARRVVEMYQGKIEVESAPGKGSTFRIMLPILKT